ncbi:flagellar basal-body rod protein FlgF [Acidovorax facilis]|uniref:flagellar basal-body rod protein FlgF n=1 Tax=Acidovorax facilis TaxID=12917 RepID=UPI003CF12D7B
MLDSIHIGATGLLGYSKGLRVIANNTANMNTPGFKSSTLQFSDMFYASGERNSSHLGHGLNTASTTISFRQGDLRQTGNDLDLAVDGQGMFILKSESGELTYTRAGQFEFNKDGILVHKVTGQRVQGFDAEGNLADITITGNRVNGAKATKTIKFGGNISSTATAVQTIGGIKVIDSLGGEHTLTAKFTNTNSTTPGSFSVEFLDGTTSIGTGTIVFANGRPVAANSTISLTYTPPGLPAMDLTMDFGTDVTSMASGSLATVAMASQDGFGASTLTNASFDEKGVLVMTYANGQTVNGSRLALGHTDSLAAIRPVGNNQFEAIDSSAWKIGSAGNGEFGNVQSGMIEVSNVDLSREFSELVIMQRGYQASSQIVSTANEMLQELFTMTSK